MSIMKKLSSLLLSLLITVTVLGQTSEQDAVKQVVQSAYVDGIQNNGEIEAIRQGFHPSFNMLRLMDNEIKPYSISEWVAAIEKRRAEAKPGATLVKTEAKFLSIDVTGNAAVVKLELHREGKLIFTDYLSLYKFNEGWRIVSKSYFRH